MFGQTEFKWGQFKAETELIPAETNIMSEQNKYQLLPFWWPIKGTNKTQYAKYTMGRWTHFSTALTRQYFVGKKLFAFETQGAAPHPREMHSCTALVFTHTYIVTTKGIRARSFAIYKMLKGKILLGNIAVYF